MLAQKCITAISLYILVAISLQTVALAEQSASSWPSLTKHVLLPPNGQRYDAFHIVVIGDSVAWGNGLNDQDKYYYLVADWLQKELNRPVDVAVYAHSGAALSGEIGESIDPNLNNGYPTLIDQAYNIQNKEKVDLILVSGGINDVGVLNIMNPYVPSEEIDRRAQSTKAPMGILLTYLLDKCSNSKIVVTNYYPIVTEDSETKLIMGAYDLGILAVNTILIEDTLDGSTAKERLTENSAKFNESSTTAITNAILESDDVENRIVLANVNFKSENSYDARETWLWKFTAPQASMVSILKTNDDQFDYRSSLASDPEDKINAVGHPNRDGAKEYARAIESAIKSKGLDWLQNENAVIQEANNTQESSQQVSSSASAGSTNQPRITWIRNFVGSPMYTISTQQTSEGGYIIASSLKNDVRLIKTDAKGDTIWDKSFEGPEEAELGRSWERAFSAQQMRDGGFNILASTSNVNGNFGWLIKTDSLGNMVWDNLVEEQYEVFSGLQTSDGEYIIGTISPDEIVGVSKIDSEGNKLWEKTLEEITFSISSNSVQLPLQQTKDGGYIIAGNKGKKSTLLIKIDDQGNELWNELISPPRLPLEASIDSVKSVQQTNDGGYIIAGSVSTDGDPSRIYGALIKTDSLGKEVWSTTFDMDDEDQKYTEIYSVLQTDDGGYILAGVAGTYITWVIKTDSSGVVEWDKKFSPFDSDRLQTYTILQTNDGGYIIAGNANLHGIGLVKIGGNEDITDTEYNPMPRTDAQEQQKVNTKEESEAPLSSTHDEDGTSESPGFGGILAVATLLCIFVFRKTIE